MVPALFLRPGICTAVLVLAALLGACGTTPEPPPAAPGQSPGTPASPSPTPSGPPADGEPSVAPSPSPAPPTPALPAGWRHELACNDAQRQCRLHLYDDRDREVPGWPVRIAGACWDQNVAIGADGTAYVACSTANRTVRVHAVTTRGATLAGWPVRAAGDWVGSTWNEFGTDWWLSGSGIAVTRDGTVVVGISTGRRYALHGFDPSGDRARGWPLRLAGSGGGFLVAADGAVIAWWYEGARDGITLDARRTVFTRLDTRGRVQPGWPIGSRGAASSPVADPDGGIVYTSATGRVYRHGTDGAVVHGWPVRLPYPAVPEVRGGRLAFVGGWGPSWVTMLRWDGRVVAGWPWRTRGTLSAPGCDTGTSSPLVLAWGDDSLFLAPRDGKGSTIVALDGRGQTRRGWPWRVPTGYVAWQLDPRGDGGVDVHLGSPCGEEASGLVVTLSATGRLTSGPIPTTLEAVYQALRPARLRTAGGATTFAAGEAVEGRVRFVNRSGAALDLPRVEHAGDWWYAAGTWQASLRPLDGQSITGCLPGVRVRNGWYAMGGEILGETQPTVVAAGGHLERAWQLPEDLTGCLPAGSYAYRIQYRRLSDDYAPSLIATVTLELELTPAP